MAKPKNTKQLYKKLKNLKTHIKKPITVRNNTHYFDPEKTRTVNTFVNPRTYYHRQTKIEGYENRLYWEWKWCEDNDGQTFYYTLTYNDANIPKYRGENCFDYEDLRSLLNGAFAKNLLRNYGTKFKYFVGAELGDGKGERGIGNNPHYHILFFLRDAENKKYPYEKISREQFRHLVREYWQGFDQDEKFKDYRKAKKGIAKEGENLGKVTDYRAVKYCAKYVCKDVGLVKRETKIEEYYRMKYKREIPLKAETYELFFDEVINKKFNVREKDKEGNLVWKWSYRELYDRFCKKYIKEEEKKYIVNQSYELIQAKGLEKEFKEFCKNRIEEKVKEKINEYRNRYCNKCRISQGVGDYALEHIKDKLNPTIGIYGKNGYKERPINLYYYRKLYNDIVKDKNGNNMYILNKLGMEHKKAQLENQLAQMKDRVLKNLSKLNKEEYDEIRKSPINTECFLYWYEVKNFLDNNENKNECIKRYCEYKLVYESRFYEIQSGRPPEIDVINDYCKFIVPAYTNVDYSNNPVKHFMENGNKGYLAYNTHAYFLLFMQFFNLFNTISDYYYIQEDNEKEKIAEEIKKTRRYHKLLEYNNFINQNFKL